MIDLLAKVKERLDEIGELKKAKYPSACQGQVLAFINQKGGVGKTTMAYNFAQGLARQGKKVLCLDMDPQANLTLLFDGVIKKDEGYNLYHLLVNSVRELKSLHTPVVFKDILLEKNNLALLPGAQDLAGLDLALAQVNTTPKQLVLKRFIEKNDLTSHYDAIIIDAPPTLGLLVINILCACHGVMVPFRPDEFSKAGLKHFYQVLDEIKEMGLTEAPKILAHIPNLVDPRRKQEGLDLKRIEEDLIILSGDKKSRVVAPFYNRSQLVRALAQKKSVYDYEAVEFIELQEKFNQLTNMMSELNP